MTTATGTVSHGTIYQNFIDGAWVTSVLGLPV